jgi:two-component system, OmpR family, sensor histidine kinase MprB
VSLRWRIALAVAAVASLTTLAVGIASYRSTHARLYDEIDRSLEVDVPDPFLFPDSVHIGEDGGVEIVGGPFGPARPLVEQQVVELDGSVVYSNHRLPLTRQARRVLGRPGVAVVETVSMDGTEYRLRTAGRPEGALQVARPLDETNRVLSSLRARTIVIVLIATAIGALLGSLIAGRVTASLRRLTLAADSVRTTGRLDVPVPDATGADEVSRLSASFSGMLGSLARSQSEQRRLVQDAGHELKTPLTSIRTNLDVLRRHPDLEGGQRSQVIGDLHAEVEEMVDLVEEIVAVAGGVASDEPATEFSLGDAAADVVDRFQRRTGRTIRLDADESLVLAQPTGVQRAISNLIDNAIKFDPSGGLIEVTVRQGRVDVLDRGPGIEPEDAPLVFERFHRGAEARTLPGSGLGLSIVRDVVDRNRGAVHAAMRLGGGAVVGFTLPAR